MEHTATFNYELNALLRNGYEGLCSSPLFILYQVFKHKEGNLEQVVNFCKNHYL